MSHPLEECSSITDFSIGVTLGTGSFGRVRFATHVGTNRHYAIKMLRKTDVVKFRQVEHIKSENEILKTLSQNNGHPFIVNMATSFQDPAHIYMILEIVIGRCDPRGALGQGSFPTTPAITHALTC